MEISMTYPKHSKKDNRNGLERQQKQGRERERKREKKKEEGEGRR